MRDWRQDLGAHKIGIDVSHEHPYVLSMPPNKRPLLSTAQMQIRLRPEAKVAAQAAAKRRGITLSALVVFALARLERTDEMERKEQK